MEKFSNVKAILFDSGHTLNYPRTGHWFLTPNFFNFVDKRAFSALNQNRLNEAFSKAMKYLDQNHTVLDEASEFAQFIEFYSIFSREFPELEMSGAAISEIARDMVFNDGKFTFYDDVMDLIPKLSQDYTLGIVSDTWPSLERVYVNAGLRKYFATFIMSSKLGVYKPDPLMYRTALSELGIKPCEALFVDDSVRNVEGAKMLGMESVLMLRRGKPDHDTGHVYINNLSELENLLKCPRRTQSAIVQSAAIQSAAVQPAAKPDMRNMKIDDYAEIYDLWARTPGVGLSNADSHPNIEKFLQRNNGLSFVCLQEGRIIGTVLCGHDGRRGYIYHTAVDVEYRGRGIGRALVEKSLDALNAEGIDKCHLFVFADNDTGKNFWASSGWTKRDDILVYSKNV